IKAGDRGRLAEGSSLGQLRVDQVHRAKDGTRKFRLLTHEGSAIESVLIPNDERGFTQCISSQVGCALTCAFCATQTLGFSRNLATWEIVDQVYQAQDLLAAEAAESGAKWPERVQNIVFMGMGEPLHNYNQVKRAVDILTDEHGPNIAGRRITISSAGLVPAIARFGREGLGNEVGLAISLNATTDSVRDRVMPINTRWNIAKLLETVREVPLHRRQRVTFEYVLLADVNDSDDDARRLNKLVGNMRCQINVIPFNPHPKAPFRRPSAARIKRFTELCRKLGLRAFVRTPRGDDIGAACGQLALKGSKPDESRPS
ncbi:MAG: 23S rRNA (adenine(2503)-C(2))-methyltransferase RlmN, partial [Nannocystaceae bacterium]